MLAKPRRTIMSQLRQEVFDVWPRQAVQRLEAESSVLCYARATEELRGPTALGNRHFAGGALHFRNWGDHLHYELDIIVRQ